jgi:hypothetical protein
MDRSWERGKEDEETKTSKHENRRWGMVSAESLSYDQRTKERTNKTNKRTKKPMNERANERTNERTNEWREEYEYEDQRMYSPSFESNFFGTGSVEFFSSLRGGGLIVRKSTPARALISPMLRNEAPITMVL